MRPNLRAAHRDSANGGIESSPARASQEYSLTANSTTHILKSLNPPLKEVSALSPASFLSSYSIGQQWRFGGRPGDPATHNVSQRTCRICLLLAAGLVVVCVLLLPPLLSADNGEESVMSVWVGRGREWQQQQQQSLQQPEQRLLPISQVLQISRDGDRGAEMSQEDSMQVAEELAGHHDSESTGGTTMLGTNETGTNAGGAQEIGIAAGAGEPAGGEVWVDPSSAWPFRYERLGMEWRESGVAFRGAQWRAAVGGWMNRHAQALPVVEAKQVRGESEEGTAG